MRLALLPGSELEVHTRALGEDPPAWRAVIAPFTHEDDPAPGGAKLQSRPLYSRATGFADAAGVEEAILFDTEERLVEGARTTLVFVDADGAASPPAARGGVTSIALGVLEDEDLVARRDCTREELEGLSELIAINAVRGARAITELDGQPVGDGGIGPAAERLGRVLEEQAGASATAPSTA